MSTAQQSEPQPGGARTRSAALRSGLARRMRSGRAALALGALLMAGWAASEVSGGEPIFAGTGSRAGARPQQPGSGERRGEFELMRVEYPSAGGAQEAYYFAYGKLWQRWETDYPEADRNFARRIAQITRVLPGEIGRSRKLTDPDLHEYPFLYMSDVGWMELSDLEREGLREYLLRGGFLWVDDFWGDAEWGNFEREMREVLPEVAWREIPEHHPLLHLVFDLPEVPQVPARDFGDDEHGREPSGLHRPPVGSMEPAHLRGYFGDDGRLMVVATHNTDLGDGFEREAYGQFYFEYHSTRAYALGANIVLYAFTH